MQRCTTCGTTYEEGIATCPRDGTPLFATESDVEGLVEVSSEGVATLDELSDAIQHWQKEDSEAIEEEVSNEPVDEPHGEPTLIIETARVVAQQDREREAVTATVPIGERAVQAPPEDAGSSDDTDEMLGTQMGAPAIMDSADSLADSSSSHHEATPIERRERAPSAVPASSMSEAEDDGGSGMLLLGLFVVLLLLGTAGTLAHTMGVFSIHDFLPGSSDEPVATAKDEIKDETREPVPVVPEPEPTEEVPVEQPPAELAAAVTAAETMVDHASSIVENVEAESESESEAESKAEKAPKPASKSSSRKPRPKAKKVEKAAPKKVEKKSPEKVEKSEVPAIADVEDEKSPSDEETDESSEPDDSLSVWGSSEEDEPAKKSEEPAKTKADADEAPLLPVDDPEPPKKTDEDASPEKQEESQAEEAEESEEEESIDIW